MEIKTPYTHFQVMEKLRLTRSLSAIMKFVLLVRWETKINKNVVKNKCEKYQKMSPRQYVPLLKKRELIPKTERGIKIYKKIMAFLGKIVL